MEAKKYDPFGPETIRLRRPLPGGKDGGEIASLTLRPPELRDALAADEREPGTMAYALAMLSSLSGVRESSLARLIPEDLADAVVSLSRANLRFPGDISLADPPEGEEEGPYDPFADEVVRLRRPLRSGEAEARELRLRPPEARDILFADGRPEGSLRHATAMLSSLCGLPEKLLGRMIPEDWADVSARLGRTQLRFAGALNLVDGDAGDPPEAEADTPPPTSAPT